MKYLLLLLALPFMSSTECGKKKGNLSSATPDQVLTDSVPPVVRKLIDSLGKENPPLVPQLVEEYSYKGSNVYLISMPCCDFFNPLYDTQGKYICAPTGGFTGRGDGKCTDFTDSAKKVRVVWKR